MKIEWANINDKGHTRNVFSWILESCSYINFPSRQYLYREKKALSKSFSSH